MVWNKYMVGVGLTLITLYSCSDIRMDSKDSFNITAAKPGTQLLPDFALADMGGNTVNMKDYLGKMIVVNIWASWCPPCRAEMPSFQRLYEKTNQENVQFIMLSVDDDFDKSLRYFTLQGLTLPAFYPAGSLPGIFDVQGIPATFIFNKKGELIKKIDGGDNYDKEAYLKLLSQ